MYASGPKPTLELVKGDDVIVRNVLPARSTISRMVGLLGRSGLPEGTGLWLCPCNAIHMFFMRFAIDAIFLDRTRCVTRVCRGLRPWQVATGGVRAHSVVELEAGWLPACAVREGDALDLRKKP